MGADDETDWEALRRALADVKPLAKGPKRRARPSYERPAVREPSQTVAGGAPSQPLRVEWERDGSVLGQRERTHQSILRALQDPSLEVQDSYDLHGRTSSEASRDVSRFVKECHERGERWLLIIVGKGRHSPGGRGTLQDHVVSLLSSGSVARYVLAFSTAPRRLGGSGALVVRLRDRI